MITMAAQVLVSSKQGIELIVLIFVQVLFLFVVTD